MTTKNDLEEFDFEMDEDEQMKEIIDLLHEIPEIPIPAQFDLKFKHALELEKKKKKMVYWKRWSAVAAVLAVGLLSVLFLQDGHPVMPTDLNLKAESPIIEKQGMKDELLQDKVVEDEALEEQDNYGVINMEKEQMDLKENQKSLASSQSSPSEIILNQTNPENRLQEEPENDNFFDSAIMETTQMPLATPSRSFGYFTTEEEFNRCSNQRINDFVKAINEKNPLGLSGRSTCTQATSVSALTEEVANIVMRLYQNIFENEEVTYQKIEKDFVPGVCQVYEVQGNGKSIQVTVTNSVEGIDISEVILDHATWLEQQMTGTTYVLENYEINEKDSIVFHVNVLVDTNGTSVNEIRSIVWN